ncbi:hypothetical protein KBD45_08240, partial [Candidatus Dojkabacteria bacterium]|nr:hypothetical protein [Candidatus Dojkabacteria bacterium]
SYTFMQDVKELTRQNHLLDKEISDLKSETRELVDDNADVVPTPEVKEDMEVETGFKETKSVVITPPSYEMETGNLKYIAKKGFFENPSERFSLEIVPSARFDENVNGLVNLNDRSSYDLIADIPTRKGMKLQVGLVYKNSLNTIIYFNVTEHPSESSYENADLTLYKYDLLKGELTPLWSNKLNSVNGGAWIYKVIDESYLLLKHSGCLECGSDFIDLKILNTNNFVLKDIGVFSTYGEMDQEWLQFDLKNKSLSFRQPVKLNDCNELNCLYTSWDHVSGEEVKIKLP